jgi:bacillithiol biosynthesis cysteine-adding enzyme BshC
MLNSIPLRSLPHYPSHLSSSSAPAAIASDGRLRSLSHIGSEHRSSLVAAIIPDLQRWNAPTAAIDAARRLADENCYAVVTGQQAGIATGPLYTLYKAIGAVREADALARQYPGSSFVPVFWIEADDHDFDEIRTISLIDRSGVTRTVSYHDNDPRPRHVGDRLVDAAAFEELLDALRQSMAETEFTEDTIGLLRKAYLGENGEANLTLADGFARALYAILGDTPLVLVSSRNSALKRLASSAFVREAENPDALYQSLVSRTADLRKAGAETPIAPKRGALFLTHDGERRALDATDDGDGVAVRGATKRMTRQELVALAASSPESLSPNVALRPIIQDAILPTAIYLGGPSEVAYLDQVHDAYPLFSQEPPRTGPRPFVLLVEPKAARVVEGSRFTLEQILQPDFNPAEAMIDPELDAAIDARHQSVLLQLQSAFGSFAELAHTIDPTLEKSLGAATAGAAKGLEDFTKRLRSALRKREQTAINRIEGARELLLPAGDLQERRLSPIYYINKYGLASFRATLERIERAPGVMQVVLVESRESIVQESRNPEVEKS